ncbi:MAG: hypothetical protein OSA48_06855 [Akkermansiaceae bacterium]|nr:hypothetical protein [Akkermansiaceae bacterium]
MHLIGVLSQQLLPRKPEGLFAAIEHLQNEGATRKWIRTQNYGEIGDLLNRADTPNNCPFLRYLVAATQQEIIEEQVARSATQNPQDFHRALKGIS